VPIFFDEWDVLLGPLWGAAFVEAIDGGRAQAEARRARRDEEDQLRLERSRWLEEHRAERSFPCGLVPDPHEVEMDVAHANTPPSEIGPVEVTAAVLPDAIAFLRDGDDDVVEVGRIPRTAVVGIDVVDAKGDHVPEPVRETIEPPQLSLLVLTWKNGSADDQDRFAFRSPWLAWRAGRKLMEARRG
jgi:hypothetical protein